MLSKLEQRFHDANYTNVKFVLITDSEVGAVRLRASTGNLNVLHMNSTADSPFSRLVLRSAYVFDKCGQLAYVIHYPWSTVMRPFIKAATLSTFYDRPCGNCNSNTDVSANVK